MYPYRTGSVHRLRNLPRNHSIRLLARVQLVVPDKAILGGSARRRTCTRAGVQLVYTRRDGARHVQGRGAVQVKGGMRDDVREECVRVEIAYVERKMDDCHGERWIAGHTYCRAL